MSKVFGDIVFVMIGFYDFKFLLGFIVRSICGENF